MRFVVDHTTTLKIMPSRNGNGKKASTGKGSKSVRPKLHEPKKVFGAVYVEPDRRNQIERAISARHRIAAQPFNSSSNQNRHNLSGTFSNFEYLHTYVIAGMQ